MAGEGKKKLAGWLGLFGTVVLGVITAHYVLHFANKMLTKGKTEGSKTDATVVAPTVAGGAGRAPRK